MNLALGLILTIAFSVMGVKELLPLGLILLGLAGQYRVFENLTQNIKKVAILQVLCLF